MLCFKNKKYLTLRQALATSGPPILMWPTSYVWSFLNNYFDFENMLNIDKMPAVSNKKTLKSIYMCLPGDI